MQQGVKKKMHNPKENTQKKTSEHTHIRANKNSPCSAAPCIVGAVACCSPGDFLISVMTMLMLLLSRLVSTLN